jgi:hypothetical protein
LLRHGGDFRLWVVCCDDTTFDVLTRLDLHGVIPVPLTEVETPELRAVRADRSRAEYYWTLTPFTPDVVFDRDPTATRATYIDADMWLVAHPAPIFRDLEESDAEVLITDHGYSPEFISSRIWGIYCVQFMPFTRDGSRRIREWWQQRCLEWCYAREEDGKFGDQKYLDDWPERFGSAVRVLSHLEWTQAPWNATRFPAAEAITFHFHRLRTTTATKALVGLYRLPRAHVDDVYRPYLVDLRAAYSDLAATGHSVSPQSPQPGQPQHAKDWLAFRLHNWPDLTTPYSLRF